MLFLLARLPECIDELVSLRPLQRMDLSRAKCSGLHSKYRLGTGGHERTEEAVSKWPPAV